MASVTARIEKIKQPYGGYLSKKQFEINSIDDGKTLNERENIHASLVGLAVDYLTRFMMGTSVKEAFKFSLKGARCLDLESNKSVDKKDLFQNNAKEFLKNIRDLNDKSIINACKLVGYDVCFRTDISKYRPVEMINPDIDTVKNISIMVNRSLAFWEKYGPIVKDAFTFEGGYTDVVSAGDGDYLTKDTLWEFKVLKNEPTSQHTLQLLMYYIMGIHSIHTEFDSIKQLGIFNPRKNKIYLANVSLISPEVIKEVSYKVIGYR